MAYAWMSALLRPQRSRAGGRKCTQGLRVAGEGKRTGAVQHRGELLLYATGELEKAAQTYELWQQTYPRDAMPYMRLGFVSATLGNWEKALEEWRAALRLDPNIGNTYICLGLAYMSLNRLDEAEAVFKQAEERKLESEVLLQSRYWLAFLKGNAAQMAQLVSAAMGKPGIGRPVAGHASGHGRLVRQAEERARADRRAMDSAQHNNAKETAAGYQAEAALREVESGNREQARAEANAALKLAPNRDVQVHGGAGPGAGRRRGRGGKAGGRTRQDLPAGHAGAEVLAAHHPGGGRPGTPRPEPGHRTIEGGEHDRTRLNYGRPDDIPVPRLCAWRSLSACCTTATGRQRNFRNSSTIEEW